MTDLLPIARKCPLCQKPGVVFDVPRQGLIDWQNGVLIQDAMPELTDDDREQIITGLHPQCQAKLYARLDEDEA